MQTKYLSFNYTENTKCWRKWDFYDSY